MWTTQQKHQRWYLIENESWPGIVLSALFQRWQTNFEITSTELWQINVDKSTLSQRWYLVEKLSQRMLIDVISALTKQLCSNSMWISQCCLNVDMWFKMKLESKYVRRRCFDVGKTTSNQLCQYLVYCFALGSCSVINEN